MVCQEKCFIIFGYLRAHTLVTSEVAVMNEQDFYRPHRRILVKQKKNIDILVLYHLHNSQSLLYQCDIDTFFSLPQIFAKKFVN